MIMQLTFSPFDKEYDECKNVDGVFLFGVRNNDADFLILNEDFIILSIKFIIILFYFRNFVSMYLKKYK